MFRAATKTTLYPYLLMKNTVIVQVNFSFKGENFTPFITVELDDFVKHNGNLSSLYSKIAQKNKIDTYSYAYEMMEASELTFHSAEGNVVEFIVDGKCDLEAYGEYLTQSNMLIELEKIASEVLGIADFIAKENDNIKDALSRAYRAGQNSTS
ncbi:MAG: hypothetical protein KAG34_04945 [Cocleimonas sp.]|nr:hypothetical protein [Cocleimonas sp.]